MKDFSYKTNGVCSKQIDFSLENGKIYNVKFHGGCPGNLAAISKLIEGNDARKVVDILKGNICGSKKTSCADQLSICIEKALDM